MLSLVTEGPSVSGRRGIIRYRRFDVESRTRCSVLRTTVLREGLDQHASSNVALATLTRCGAGDEMSSTMGAPSLP